MITLVACSKKDDECKPADNGNSNAIEFTIKIDSLNLSNTNNIPFEVNYKVIFNDSAKQAKYDSLKTSYAIDTFYANTTDLSCIFKFKLKDNFNTNDIKSIKIFYKYLISTQQSTFYFLKNSKFHYTNGIHEDINETKLYFKNNIDKYINFKINNVLFEPTININNISVTRNNYMVHIWCIFRN